MIQPVIKVLRTEIQDNASGEPRSNQRPHDSKLNNFGAVFASKGYPFKSIFDFNTASAFVAAVERLTALHYSVDLLFLSFGIMETLKLLEGH